MHNDVNLEVGKTYISAENAEVKIGWVSNSVPRLFRPYQEDNEYWFSNGEHMSGNKAKALKREQSPAVYTPPVPAAPVLGEVIILVAVNLATGKARILAS